VAAAAPASPLFSTVSLSGWITILGQRGGEWAVLSTLICAHGFFTCAQPQKERKAAIKISVVNEDFVGHFIRNYGPISKLLNCRLVFQRERRKNSLVGSEMEKSCEVQFMFTHSTHQTQK